MLGSLVGWLRSHGVTTIHTGHGPGALVSGGTMIAKTAGDTADVLLAITESDLSTSVARGENAGRRLGHVGVARTLSVIGAAAGETFKAEPLVSIDGGWRREKLRAVVFVQERASKRVLGAAAIKLFG